MSEIKLARLPDRTPVKFTVSLTPELSQALCDYAVCYEQAYGTAEPVHELVPAMLASFLESDRIFARRRKSRGGAA